MAKQKPLTSPLLTELTDLRNEMQRAFTEAVRDGQSSNGIAALGRQVRGLIEAINDEQRRLEQEAAVLQDEGPMTESELIQHAVDDLNRLPDPLLDAVLRGLVDVGRGAALRRCAPPALRVIGQ